jgi:acetyltransferase
MVMERRPLMICLERSIGFVYAAYAQLGRGAHVSQPSTQVRLRDGTLVALRDATIADVPRLRELFYTLSATTRYLFFCLGAPSNEIWAERVAALAIVDGVGAYAMIAEVEGTVVGVARFDRNVRSGSAGSDTAEIGILLTDAWQSRGLGREVVARLRCEALRCGFAGFTATVLGENQRALRLLRRIFPGLRGSIAYGQYTLDLPFHSASAAGLHPIAECVPDPARNPPAA